MGLIKEPMNVDFSTKSEPWTDKELSDFRKIMETIKAKNAVIKKRKSINTKKELQH
jgi:hypothetical protein